jgi:glutamate racemase
MKCKLIVVACKQLNAIQELSEYDIPFIGIEPAIKPAVTHSKTQIIGILLRKER